MHASGLYDQIVNENIQVDSKQVKIADTAVASNSTKT